MTDDIPGRRDGHVEPSAEVLEELAGLFGPEPERDSGAGGPDDVVTITDESVSGTFTVDESDRDGSVTVVDEPAGLTDASATAPGHAGGPGHVDSGPDARVLPFRPVPEGAGADPLIVIEDEPDVPADRDVDPRFEERRRAWARRDRLKRVRWLKIALILLGLGIFVLALMASPLFAIRTFVMEGNVYTADETVDDVRDILKGSSIFTADITRARKVLLDDPWVSEVRISTHFPSRVVVEVSERVPVVWYVGTDGKARMVDARGKVIAVLDGFPTKYLQVKGTGPEVAAGNQADDAYRAAAQLVLALPDEIRPKVTALDLSPAGELSMVLKGDTLVRFGTPTGLQDKLVAVVVLLRRQDPRTIAVIDVSAGEPTVLGR
jgi:cell division protein FtsQ